MKLVVSLFLVLGAGALALFFWMRRETDLAVPTLAPAVAAPAPVRALPPVAETPAVAAASRAVELPVPTIALRVESDPLAKMAEEMRRPENRRARVQQKLLEVELSHALLWQSLASLGPEGLAQAKQRLAEALVAEAEAALPTTLADAQNGVRERIQKMETMRDAHRQAFAREFGAAAGEKLQHFERTLPQRESVNKVATLMRSRGVALSEGDQERLLSAYTDAIQASAEAGAKDVPGGNLSGYSEAQIQALRQKQTQRFDEAMATRVASVLSPEALKAFMDAQLQMDQAPPRRLPQ